MAIEKPQLRGLHVKVLRMNLITAVASALTVALSYKYLVTEPLKQRYADFYRTYDVDKQLEILNQSGEMQSYIK